MKDDKQILLASQKDAADDEPRAGGIYRMGVLANVLRLPSCPALVRCWSGSRRACRSPASCPERFLFRAAETVTETENAAAIRREPCRRRQSSTLCQS